MRFLIRPLLLVCFFFSCKTSQLQQPEQYTNYDNSFLKDVQISIHRGGGFEEGWPENSLESFKHYHEVLPKAMIECDVRMTKDSVLVLMHDESLERTSTGSGLVSEKTYKELSVFFLKDNFGNITSYKIPTFNEVLQWANQETPLTVDIKRNIPHQKIIEEIETLDSFGNCLLTTYSWSEVLTINNLSKKAVISVGIRSMDEYR
ncbi:glycerophosphodiester phosphodiesterase family protein [Jiulongibacter sediminis]|uniref:glycerophosphodiester phosphodiesterase family protein n=1 Tax=Jiulongibacter sediminis TaxID=1605367 RepID=UPI0006DCEA98|nr:glycerophosphodiester phosphodiesterase family protein [Jiulongibacter sediminis]